MSECCLGTSECVVCVCVYVCVSLLVPISRFSHFFNVTLGGSEDEAVLVCVCVS